MIFLIECVVACALFTAMLEILCAKRREILTNDYPPVVTEKLRSLNIVSEKPKRSDIIRKLIAVIIFMQSCSPLSCDLSTALRHF